jgi:hypothetical protein
MLLASQQATAHPRQEEELGIGVGQSPVVDQEWQIRSGLVPKPATKLDGVLHVPPIPLSRSTEMHQSCLVRARTLTDSKFPLYDNLSYLGQMSHSSILIVHTPVKALYSALQASSECSLEKLVRPFQQISGLYLEVVNH